MRPLTDKENAIADLVGRGLTVKEIRVALGKTGYFLAEATLVTRIRDIANKVPNPYQLPPMAAIKSFVLAREEQTERIG